MEDEEDEEDKEDEEDEEDEEEDDDDPIANVNNRFFCCRSFCADEINTKGLGGSSLLSLSNNFAVFPG